MTTERTPSGFETVLQNGEQTATVRIEGRQVIVAIGDQKPVRWTYKALEEQACCVFEANVQALEALGYHVVSQGEAQVPSGTPGSLDLLPPQSEDALYWARWVDGRLDAVSIDVADPVALWDGTHRDLQAARKLALFDKSKLDPIWEPEHMLRRLFAHPASDNLRALELVLYMAHDRILDRFRAAHKEHLLTHLYLGGAWRDKATMTLRPLGASYPRLKTLSLPRWSTPQLLAVTLPQLTHVSLHRVCAEVDRTPPPQVPVKTALSLIEERAPALESLTLREANHNPETLRVLLTHPIMDRLRRLDIVATNHRVDIDLIESTDVLRYLDQILISDHLLNDDDRARLGDLGNVCLVSHRMDSSCYLAHMEAIGP